ncbi:MAG: ABC transporter substrate-binding protein [Opitutales bacterium]|nr:ABC transporter substrate-binding protein [Opitutales bacterium]
MKINFPKLLLLFSIMMCMLLSACTPKSDKTVIRMGHFPNISHAQALVAHQLSRQGKGWFEERLGKDVELQWALFNAGPSAMESLLSEAIDITYVGPSPAINAFSRTKGEDIRIIAGSADGGASLVVNPNKNITKPSDFKGKRIGTPQLGNTQDVACRAWLTNNGINVTLTGGDAYVIATPNPEQLSLLRRGVLDAVWTIEPWVTRLIDEAGAKIYLEQKDTVTTVLVSGVKLIKERPDLVKKFINAHIELTDWINKNPEQAQKLVHAELQALTGGRISFDLVKKSWSRLIFTPVVNKKNLQDFVNSAYDCKLLKERTDITNIFYK